LRGRDLPGAGGRRRPEAERACTATCGSFAQAWMQRSPPLIAGSSWSPAKVGGSTEDADDERGLEPLAEADEAAGEERPTHAGNPIVDERGALPDDEGQGSPQAPAIGRAPPFGPHRDRGRRRGRVGRTGRPGPGPLRARGGRPWPRP
jgi:hypothetical protein